MPISSLFTLLSVIGVLAVVGLALCKVSKPPVEQASLPVETTTALQTAEETLPEVSGWPVAVLLCVVVGLIVGLMVFGNVIGG